METGKVRGHKGRGHDLNRLLLFPLRTVSHVKKTKDEGNKSW